MASLCELRQKIRQHTLASENQCAQDLLTQADLGEESRARARKSAADFVRMARGNAKRSGLIDKFLQEYGLSTAEGVTLMRLAEALLRTPDAATADALIRDKVEAGDWSAHRGKSPFPLVNFSTNALMLTAAWLDDIEAKDPARAMLKATKSLLDRVGEPVIRASVAQAMKIMGEHFVLGETIEEAMDRGKNFGKKGYFFSFDMLGEAAHTEGDAKKYFDDYANAINAISKFSTHEKAVNNPGISVKLSALHPRYEYGKKSRVLKELGARTNELARQACAANMGFNIDAEEVDRLDLSLDLIEQMMRDPKLDSWEGFGVVVQAYQRRAPFVLDWLATLAKETGRRIMVRLVKGAYWDSEIKRAQTMGLDDYPVFTRKILTDVSYLACARKILHHHEVFYPQFATHNALTATSVQEMANSMFDEPYKDYELQRLHGMGEQLHDTMIEQGMSSRIYAPVGGHKELLPYLVRRLLENGANSSFVNQLIDPDLEIEDIVASPVEQARDLTKFPNPEIPAPCDTLRANEILGDIPARRSARGLDLTDPVIAEAFTPDAHKNLSIITAHGLGIEKNKALKGKSFPILNPADHNHQIGTVHHTDLTVLDSVMTKARNAFPTWATRPTAERCEFIHRASDLLEERTEEFMHLAVFEAGKSWEDAIAEVREAIDFCRYYANQGQYQAQDLQNTKIKGQAIQGTGIIGCISPWNFPLAIFLGQITANLAVGNCVIAKPAEQTPIIGFKAIKLLYEAGIPEDVLYFLPGNGEEIGHAIVAHPECDGVVFTGSTPVAQIINKTLNAKHSQNPILVAETGGINAMIIDSTALMEQAVNDVIASAFQSAGQRCSACRIICIQSDTADQFNKMLAGAMAELSVGNPADRFTDVGPVIDEEAHNNIKNYLANLSNHATLIATAPLKKNANFDPDNGFFIAPTAYEFNTIKDITREIFGPVLHIVRYEAKNLEQLIDEINGLGFGLTMGVHTRIDETMHKIAERAKVGNLYVNRNQIGAVVGVQPFGGENLSGTGPKAGGPHYLTALCQTNDQKADNSKLKNITPALLQFSNRDLPDQEHHILTQMEEAFSGWQFHSGRADIFKKARHSLAQSPNNQSQDNQTALEILSRAKDYAEHFFDPVITLPGPTGESNTLRMKPMGIILCLGNGSDNIHEDLTSQIAINLAAGNATCLMESIAMKAQLTPLLDHLAKAGMPQNLVSILDNTNASQALLTDLRINAIALEGQSVLSSFIKDKLGTRTGAITQILSYNNPYRFAVERTLTINTTAAGGDVRLLSLNS